MLKGYNLKNYRIYSHSSRNYKVLFGENFALLLFKGDSYSRATTNRANTVFNSGPDNSFQRKEQAMQRQG